MNTRSVKRQGGYSLLEILVALLVLSIGLLGLAGLQTASLQSNQSAAQVSQATTLAQDLLDRMRANTDAARSGDYDVDFGDFSGSGSGIAAEDMDQWLRQVQTAFPGLCSGSCDGDDCGASVSVDRDGRVMIDIRWADERLDEDNEQRLTSFRTASRI